MKTKLLIILCIFITAGTIAQPILTGENTQPTIGDIITLDFADTTGITTGESGANQIWDYSDLQYQTSFTSEYLDASATPSGYLFPTSTHSSIGSSGNYSYSTLSSSVTQLDGMVTTDNIVMKYSDPEILFSYPIGYNSINTDDFYCFYDYGMGITGVRSGSNQMVADGYGTLILPYGTFTDVLRLKFTQSYSDNLDFLGTPMITSYETINYYWCQAWQPSSLLAINKLTITSNGQNASYKTVQYLAENSLEIENSYIENDINVYPLPAYDYVNVSFENYDNYDIRVLDIHGKEQIYTSYSGNMISIDISSLCKGFYMLDIRSDKINCLKKITIQ